MMDREILEKYIYLNNSCLDKEEKTKVMDMLYKYREAFILRDEIGTCPNIEVEIDATDTDKLPFFIRPYHVREDDKAFIDKEIKQLCYMSIMKEGFSAYSSPVMLISRKLTKDKRMVTDFRHLNMRPCVITCNRHMCISISHISANTNDTYTTTVTCTMMQSALTGVSPSAYS